MEALHMHAGILCSSSGNTHSYLTAPQSWRLSVYSLRSAGYSSLLPDSPEALDCNSLLNLLIYSIKSFAAFSHCSCVMRFNFCLRSAGYSSLLPDSPEVSRCSSFFVVISCRDFFTFLTYAACYIKFIFAFIRYIDTVAPSHYLPSGFTSIQFNKPATFIFPVLSVGSMKAHFIFAFRPAFFPAVTCSGLLIADI